MRWISTLSLCLAIAPPATAADPGDVVDVVQDEVDDALDLGPDDWTFEAKKKKKSKSNDNGFNLDVGTSGIGESGVSPEGREIGIGIQVGAPTGVTGKFMLTGNQGVVLGVGLGAGFVGSAALSLHADYLWHPHILARADPFKLSWYIGGGIQSALIVDYNPFFYTGLGNSFGRPVLGIYYTNLLWFGYAPPIFLAGRMPLGVNIALNQLPFEIYLELAPSLLVFPALGLGLGGAAGFRFYF